MSSVALDSRGALVACGGCGQKNRIPFNHFGEAGTCGKCHEPVTVPGEPIEVDSDEKFATLIRDSRLPVLVDFWAAWCGPCRMMAPEFAKAAHTLRGQVVLAKVDTEAFPVTASRYEVQSLPTIALFTGGREEARELGARPAAAIVSFAQSGIGTRAKR